MKTSIALACLIALAGTASAECYLRSSTVNETKGRVERVTDISRDITPTGTDQMQCNVTFRIMIDGTWYTALGRAVGDRRMNENQLCAQAQDIGRADILQRVDGSRTSMKQEMVCTDQDLPKWRPVNPGDVVRESDVTPHWDAKKRTGFVDAVTHQECRWFMETAPYKNGGMAQSEGIICKMNDGAWLVHKKWLVSRVPG